MFPVKIEVKEKIYLNIAWDNGAKTQIKLANLRMNCPCAVCVSERENQSSKYIPIYSGLQLKVKNIEVVGNYALAIIWADEHNTGIYDFGFLKKISNIIN